MLQMNTDNVVLDLNGNTITASDEFKSTFDNDSHLINISGKNVTVENGTLVATDKNKHVVNVYGAENTTLENLTLDHTNAAKGAPLVINSSDVTLAGDMKFITGAKSWYAVNVDNAIGDDASVTVAKDSKLTFEGNSEYGIDLETSKTGSNTSIKFEENVDIVTPETFALLFKGEAQNSTITIDYSKNPNIAYDEEKGIYVTVDKSDLEQEVNSDSALIENNFTAESWEKFENAFNAAKEVLADSNSLQGEIDQVLADLKEARMALVKVEAPTTDGTTTTEKPVQTPATDEKTESPETGAMVTTGLFASMAILSGAIAIVLKKKKELN